MQYTGSGESSDDLARRAQQDGDKFKYAAEKLESLPASKSQISKELNVIDRMKAGPRIRHFQRMEQWENDGRTMGEQWENNGRTMGEQWENNGRTMGEQWEKSVEIGRKSGGNGEKKRGKTGETGENATTMRGKMGGTGYS